jgi:hypothetical protein
MFVLSTQETDAPVVPDSEGHFSLDDRIALVLSEGPFLSVRQIAEKVMLSNSIVYAHLTQAMTWKLSHLKWVPQTLTESEKNKPSAKRNRTFGASTVDQTPRVEIYCHP